MSGDGIVRVWTQVGRFSQGSPVSIAHVCAAALTGVGADGAAVTVMINSTLRDTVHATDQRAGELEEWQLALGQGPCVDAFALGGPALAADLGSRDFSRRWPAFTAAALDSGARALFALPMQVGAIRLGVLDLYRTRPGALTSYDLSSALMFADAAGMLLLDGADRAHADRADPGRAYLDGAYLDGAHLDGAYPDGAHLDGAHLDGAHLDGAHLDGAHLDGAHLDGQPDGNHGDGARRDGALARLANADGAYGGGTHRYGSDGAHGARRDGADPGWPHDDPTAQQAQVHQATGMILVQLGISAEAAFARLRAYVYAHDRRLGDVARDVVGRRLRFDPDLVPGDHDGGQP